ncbi:hypothetical protein [Gemmiger sp.]
MYFYKEPSLCRVAVLAFLDDNRHREDADMNRNTHWLHLLSEVESRTACRFVQCLAARIVWAALLF